ncbi:MAG: M3 family metallopeptidase [Bacteroidales bacterium]|nr:M3 family metallopeptidase [Bacteroidales bacterium]
MKRNICIMTMVVATALLTSGCKDKNEETVLKDNPFMEEWDTPYGVPPFDKIKPEHYLPAFEEGMKQQKENIDAIVNNTEDPTFENTIIPLEYSDELLNKVSMVFFNLTECCNDEEMEKLADTIMPLVTQHGDDVMLNEKLFQKVKTVYDNREKEKLNPEQLRLLEETYKGFVRGGANVPAEKQARFREINTKLASLTQKFGNNVLKATNAYTLVVDDVKKLDGLTEQQLQNAKELGNENAKTKGKYVFTLDMPTLEPFLMNCKNRELRKQIWTAYSNRCLGGEFDNSKIIDEIANLRLEKAQILGFDNYANYSLDDAMAKNADNVYALLKQVWTPALAKAKEEAAQYQKMIDKERGGFKLEPYDWRYYSEKLRKEKYDLNDEDIRPYFALDTAQQGLFMVCNKLYGLTFKENKDIPVYQKDVKVYEVIDNNEVIAIVYMDFFPRASKRSGAWMTNFREQYYSREGKNIIPVVSLVFNFTKPSGDKPAMLNIDELQTMFHEFGHALHSILSRCHYRSLSGTNVPRDYVEMPSQFMEHFSTEPEVLKMYAHHYKTGETIPDALIAKMEAAATYGQGFINTELLAASLLDMDYHTITSKKTFKQPDYEKQQLEKIGLIPSIISRYKSPYFQHIFSGGYGAGYYSYTWAAVLDNDAFEAFKENGIFDQATATAFRTNILERGNTDDAMNLYVAFRGKEPSIEPLLRNRGLK